MHRLRAYLEKTYGSLDARSLALLRIALASVLLTDLWLRSRVLDAFYTNEGLLPNHTLLWMPVASQVFSLFFTASHHSEALFGMLLCGVAFGCLLIGYHTRLAQVASFIAVVSLDARIAPLENGGDVVLNLLCMWTLFLPLGRRCSVDALRASLRDQPRQSLSACTARPIAPTTQRVRSLACLALILQLFTIYYFNVAHKTGPTWRDGTAVHYTLHQDRIVKPLGIWVRNTLPPSALVGLTRAAVIAESVAAAAVISPIFTNVTRTVVVLLVPALHAGFEACLDLGIFSFAMMAFATAFVTEAHWRALERLLQRWHAPRRVHIDADSAVCQLCAALWARLDVLQRLQFAPLANTDDAPGGNAGHAGHAALQVTDLRTGRVHRGPSALAALLRSLPLGCLVAWPLGVPGLSWLFGRCLAAVSRRRQAIGVFLGLEPAQAAGAAAATGRPQDAPRASEPQPSAANAERAAAAVVHADPAAPIPIERAASAPVLRWRRRLVAVAREIAVALCLFAAVCELLNVNAAVPAHLRFKRPAWLLAFIQYPRARQAWTMFAPHAPVEDFMIEVDATTQDGRHVDPYNQIASREWGPGLDHIPQYLHQNQFFTAYSLFAWMPHFRPYLQALREWILRYPDRTGHPSDRIVAFRVYKLSDKSPVLGKRRPTGFTRTLFLSYPP